MSEYGILVDYEYCTACHACEVACKQEYKRPAGKHAGVKVIEEVHQFPGGGMDVVNYPLFTKGCNMCRPRTKKGLLPSCVQHCMAACLEFGKLEELVRKMGEKKRISLWRP